MESGEENTAANSKRPRAPLSDSEDNVLLPSDGQKRRRLESAAGEENRSPTPSSSGRRAELDVKPDTPAITSVRSRLQLLSQTRPGGPVLARAESDPGSAGSPSVFLLDSQGFRQQLLGEGEFNQRQGRFRAPLFEPSPAAGHHLREASCPRSLSNFVSDIHQKIQGNVTPSSKEASRIRQEREQEVRLLVSQPIANNVWLKRSNSDPSLAEQGKTSPRPSCSSWIAPTRSRRIWPPSQSWDGKTSPGLSSDWTAPPPTRSRRIWPPSQALDQVDGDTEMKDGSYSEVFAASTETVQPKTTGENTTCESSDPVVSVELEHSKEWQVEMEWKEPEATRHPGQNDEKNHFLGNEKGKLNSCQPDMHVVLESPVDEEQSVSGLANAEAHGALGLVTTEEQGASDLATMKEQSPSVLATLEEQVVSELSRTEERSVSELATTEEKSALELATTEKQSALELATTEEQSALELATTEEQRALELATTEEQSALELSAIGEQSASELSAIGAQSASVFAASEEESVSLLAVIEEQGLFTTEEQNASEVATSEEQSASEVATSEEQSASEVATSEEQSASEVATSEEQSASEVATSEEQSASEVATSEEQSASGSPAIDKQRTKEAFKVTAEKDSVSIEENYKFNELSHGEETEPSTDEEPSTWRYPESGVYREVELFIVEHEDPACTKGREECNSPTEVTGFPISEELEDTMESTSAEERDGSKMLPDDLVRDQRDVVQFLKPTPERDPVNTVNHKEVQMLTPDAVKVEVMNVDIIYNKANSSTETQTCDIEQEDMELSFGSKRGNSIADEVQAVKDGQGKDDPEDIELGSNGADVETVMEAQNSEDEFTHISMEVPLTEKCVEAGAVISPALEREQVAIDEQLAHENNRSHKRGILKNVSFILEPQLIKDSTLSEMNTFSEPRRESSSSEGELNSRDEANTAELIDEMFGEVLEYAGKMEAEQKRADVDTEDSGISACSGEKDKMDCEKEKSEGDEDVKEDHECEEELDASRDELTFPPTGILSPLSKSVEAVVTPLRLAVTLQSNPISLLLTPEKLSTPPAESSPLYSIDAYRTQRQSNVPTFQSVTPTIQRKAQEKSRPQRSINVKDKILALNEEALKLQTVISQTLQALSCCTDEEHGRGSATEAEAEKLLLVSCEKRAALLAEVARLREERLLESEEAGGATSSLVPCRGTVAIGNIQLPLKVEFVYSSRNRTGQPSHYFFVLIRYGPCNIVATPLATAADAKNGDTISFPTSVTMKDIRSNFEIDVEVYSLSHTSGNTCNMESSSTKPRVTPRKLLNTIMHRSSNSITSATLSVMNTRRSSNFCLVGSHKITLASLGQSKFPLDKMKLEGKIRRLLGDEFQEKVPFLSPLEGNIYLYLGSESHSNVQHQGFLTMFEMIKDFGVWNRRFFVLDGSHMYYWNHPNDRESKAPEGSVSLSSSSSRCVKPVARDSCARPFTFELASNIVEQKRDDDSQQGAAKGWFSADTKGEQSEWMEKLNQVLLDVHTWSRPQQTTQTDTQTIPVKACSSSRTIRESSL